MEACSGYRLNGLLDVANTPGAGNHEGETLDRIEAQPRPRLISADGIQEGASHERGATARRSAGPSSRLPHRLWVDREVKVHAAADPERVHAQVGDVGQHRYLEALALSQLAQHG